MLYDVTGATFELLDLNGDGIPDTRRPVVQTVTVDAESGDHAAELAVANGLHVVNSVVPSAYVTAPAEAGEAVKRGPGRPKKVI